MKWTWLDELVQNIIGLAIISLYLYMTISGKDVPTLLEGLVVADIAYYGFKAIKRKNV